MVPGHGNLVVLVKKIKDNDVPFGTIEEKLNISSIISSWLFLSTLCGLTNLMNMMNTNRKS